MGHNVEAENRVEQILELLAKRQRPPLRSRHIRLRRMILETYRRDGRLSEGQALAVLSCILYVPQNEQNEVVAKLTGSEGSLLDKRRLRIWKDLGDLGFKSRLGRRLEGRTLVLHLDALLLCGCQNAYLHLLRDDLTLRWQRLCQKERKGKTKQDLRQERSKEFIKACKAAEVDARRIWIRSWGTIPPKPPEDWSLRVRRQLHVDCISPSTLDSVGPPGLP